MDTVILMVDAAPVDAHGEPPTDSEQLPTAATVKEWTEAELLSFKQLRDILRNDENRKTFEKAQIDGEVFLQCGEDRRFWTGECNLPLGPSAKLAGLAQRIKNMGKEKRDERIKSKNSRVMCDPKAIAN